MRKVLSVTAFEIPAQGRLDAITVYFEDLSPSKGRVTITCWGCAWTAYWGGMGKDTITQFFAGCGNDYLVNKLGVTQLLKQRKTDLAYLSRIVDAIKAELHGEG